MKNIFTLFALCICAIAQAKETGEEMLTTAGPVVGGGFPHFTPIGGNDRINNKVSLRLVGKTFLQYNGSAFIPYDSNVYSYSNDRGGVPSTDQPSIDEKIYFDHSYSYSYDALYGNYKPVKHRFQSFTSDNKILSLVYSTWKDNVSSWKDSARYLYGYSNGKMMNSALEIWYGNMWTNSQNSTIEYSGDKVSKMNSDFYKVEFSYDANNNLMVMSDSELKPAGWQNKERKSYEYAGKDVIKYTLERWEVNVGAWVPYKKWEYLYTGLDVTTETEYDWAGNVWKPYGKHGYTYDGSHNVLTDDWQLWNNNMFLNSTRHAWTYNGQNLPVKMTTTTWDGSSWVNSVDDFEYHFYYENYFPSSVKNDTELAGVSINTYPNPTTNELHVELGLNNATNLDFSIISMSGTQVRHWNENASRNYSKVIEVSDLPSGNYFVRVNSDNQQLIKQFVVSK